MANDPGPATNVPRWCAVASVAWLRIIRCLMRCHVLSPRQAIRWTAPWHLAAHAAGLRLPARFYEAAAAAGLELPGDERRARGPEGQGAGVS